MLLLGVATVAAFSATPAFALPSFKKLFDQAYVAESGDAAFQEAFKKAGCNACHVKGKPKSMRNAYGEEIAKLIPGDAKDRISEAKEAGTDDAEKAKVDKEFMDALKKVEALKSAGGRTYGEILKAHELP